MPALGVVFPQKRRKVGDQEERVYDVADRESLDLELKFLKIYPQCGRDVAWARLVIRDGLTHDVIRLVEITETDQRRHTAIIGLPDKIIVQLEMWRGEAEVLVRELPLAVDVLYDDTAVAPPLGVENVQDAIDALKSGIGPAGFELREILIGPFTELVPPGTAINIQTGAYAGANSPAPVVGDSNIILPASGAAFMDDGRIEVHLNGQELTKGNGSGNGQAEWVSATQIKLSLKIKNKDEVLVRAPYPTA